MRAGRPRLSPAARGHLKAGNASDARGRRCDHHRDRPRLHRPGRGGRGCLPCRRLELMTAGDVGDRWHPGPGGDPTVRRSRQDDDAHPHLRSVGFMSTASSSAVLAPSRSPAARTRPRLTVHDLLIVLGPCAAMLRVEPGSIVPLAVIDGQVCSRQVRRQRARHERPPHHRSQGGGRRRDAVGPGQHDDRQRRPEPAEGST